MPNPAWGGQGVLRNTPGAAVSYEMGVKVQNKNSEVAIYVQWYEKTDLNSDERKYRVNGTLRPSVQNNQLLLHTGLKMQLWVVMLVNFTNKTNFGKSPQHCSDSFSIPLGPMNCKGSRFCTSSYVVIQIFSLLVTP